MHTRRVNIGAQVKVTATASGVDFKPQTGFIDVDRILHTPTGQ